MSYLDKSVSTLKGVGQVKSKQLAKLGIETIKDLIYYFPRAYEKRGDVIPLSCAELNVPASFILTVGTTVRSAKINNRLTVTKFKAFDESGTVEVVFFNSPFVKDIFKIGTEFRFFGKIVCSKNQIQLTNPKYEPYLESVPLPDFVPVYSLTEGISSKTIDKLVLSVIDEGLSNISDYLPETIRLNEQLPSLSYALKNAHFPDNEDALKKSLRRLAFDEMLLFGLSIAVSAKENKNDDGIPFSPCSLKPLLDLLPYELTDDQKKAINDVYRDMVIKNENGKISPMSRILVGDVGSGKTICAVAAIYIAAKSGYQSALMVPTEILARQHYSDIKELFSSLGIRAELLIGNTTQKEKNRIYDGLSNGEISVVVGTHALISDKVKFNALGLVVTDEQHRFGVAQRSKLKEKSEKTHMLVMSATPIPRTLALTLYGDLDISRIVQMPKGRMRVDTFAVDESYRARLNDFIKKQVMLGGQCYVVCPSIESKDNELGEYFTPETISNPLSSQIELKNAVEYTESLRRALPDVNIEYLHGKMKACEKDEIMQKFASNEINVLVSTTVIEVGINVPNASLMIVENAERFGLSQLHQLRGRVGRGSRKSYCVLVSDMKTDKALERLNIMKTTYDGYEIADKDLAMRGPGDFFSSNSRDNFRQSGGFEFKFAKLCDDNALFESAFSHAKEIAKKDPELMLFEHSGLRKALAESYNANVSSIS